MDRRQLVKAVIAHQTTRRIKNMVMLEDFLSAREIDGVLLGSDWGTQLDLFMSPDIWLILRAELPWYKIYPFFLAHMLMFGGSGFFMAYTGPALSVRALAAFPGGQRCAALASVAGAGMIVLFVAIAIPLS